jgi:Mrp family chromosome partitioning ATPase
MPPGTGDSLLTFSQEIDNDGAVIITTPHNY